MTATARSGLLDTSVFIAFEAARPIDAAQLPEHNYVCPVTIAELKAGVHADPDVETQARRLATLEAVNDIEVLVIDAAVGAEWARLRIHLAKNGRRVNVNDLWIAATAAANGVSVVTQDDDFEHLEGLPGVSVIHV